MSARDPLHTLRNLRDVARDTVGLRAFDLARYELRGLAEVQADLDKLRHDGLVEHSRDPMGTEWWSVSAEGDQALAEKPAASPGILDRLEDRDADLDPGPPRRPPRDVFDPLPGEGGYRPDPSEL